MNTPPVPPNTLPTPPWPRLASLLHAIGDPVRWRILDELSAGEPLMVVEMAGRLGRSADLVSKHLAVLREAGLVETGRGRLYQIAKPYRPAPGERLLDFGHCVLRMGAAE